jgi:hypothetical protein
MGAIENRNVTAHDSVGAVTGVLHVGNPWCLRCRVFDTKHLLWALFCWLAHYLLGRLRLHPNYHRPERATSIFHVAIYRVLVLPRTYGAAHLFDGLNESGNSVENIKLPAVVGRKNKIQPLSEQLT